LSFTTSAPLTALATMLGSVTGIQDVRTGVPESLSNRVSAYVTVSGQRIIDKASGLLQREADYFIEIGYRVQGAEATAETTVAAALDDFVADFYAARKNGTGLFLEATTQVKSGSLDLSLASSPEYRILAGQEYRLQPIVVTVVQYANT